MRKQIHMCKTMGAHHTMKAAGLMALRIAVAAIFIYTGYSKLGPGHDMASGMFGGLFPGSGSAWAYFVGIAELVGGLMVLLGVWARYAAVWLSVIMIVAMLTVHRGGPFTGYFVPLALLGGCLALVGAGAGPWRLVKSECHCKDCKLGGKDGGCCGSGACGGCGEKKEGGMMEMKKDEMVK